MNEIEEIVRLVKCSLDSQKEKIKSLEIKVGSKPNCEDLAIVNTIIIEIELKS